MMLYDRKLSRRRSPEGGRVGWGRQTLPKDHFCKQNPRRKKKKKKKKRNQK